MEGRSSRDSDSSYDDAVLASTMDMLNTMNIVDAAIYDTSSSCDTSSSSYDAGSSSCDAGSW